MPRQNGYGWVVLVAGLSVLIVAPTIKAVPRGAQPLPAVAPKVAAIPSKGAPRDVPLGDTAKRLGFDALGVTLSSLIPISAFGSNVFAASDVWGYVSPSGREYAIIGLNEGTGFVEVTDPFNPIVLANIPDARSTWSDIAVYDQYAYNVNESDGGLQVFDMTQVDSGLITLVREVTGGWQTAHNIFINPESGYAYPCGTDAIVGTGFLVFDLADPSDPQPVGWWDDNYGHDLYVVNYDACPISEPHPRAGLPCEIAFVFGGGSGLFIVDVTDKWNITTITSYFPYPDLTYCHQGWLTEDRKYVFIGDEGDEFSHNVPTTTYVVDVQDLANPQYVTSFSNGLSSVDHNLMVRGDFVFEANYSSGLRIYDISDINSASEVGYFDTYPWDNATHYGGAWGVYSGLPSGTILISDGTSGLFVLDASGAVGCLSDLSCGDGDPCTADTCLATGACNIEQLPAGTACDDGNVCTINGQCDAAGACIVTGINTIPCTDDTPCWPGTCDLGGGFCVCEPCTSVDPPEPETVVTPKNRYLSFTPGNPGLSTALRVTLSSLPTPFDGSNGARMWVGEPFVVTELSGSSEATPPPSFTAARLSCEPVFWDWGLVGPVHVLGDAVVPGGSYTIQAINLGCYAAGFPGYSGPLAVQTSMWGDMVGDCGVTPCTSPDGLVNFIDISAVVEKFKNLEDSLLKSRADLAPALPDLWIDFVDISVTVDAFRSMPYPFDGPGGCR